MDGPGPSDQGGTEASGLLDWFSDATSEIQQTNSLIETAIGHIREQNEGLSQIANSLGAQGGVGQEFPFPVSALIPAGTSRQDEYETEFDAPYDGRLTRIVMECDPAAQQGLGVRVGDSVGDIWVPRGGNVRTSSGDDGDGEPDYQTIPTQPLTIRPGVEVDQDNPINVQFINNDPNDEHWATVIVFLRRL